MSETVANNFSGLVDTARRARVRRVSVKIGHVEEDPLEDTHAAGDEVAQSEEDEVANRLELGRELSAIHAHSHGWALACCRWERDMAEDVLHTTYLKVLDGKARYAGHASFRTWLFAVIRMTARETRRKKWRRNLVWQKYAPATAGISPPASGSQAT